MISFSQQDSSHTLHVRKEKKISIFEELDNLCGDNDSTHIEEKQEELSQNKLEKKSFYENLLKFKQKIFIVNQVKDRKPANIPNINIHKRILLGQNRLITDFFKTTKRQKSKQEQQTQQNFQAHLPCIYGAKYSQDQTKHLEYSTDTIGPISDSNSFNVDTSQSTFKGSNAVMNPPPLKQSQLKRKRTQKHKNHCEKALLKINLGNFKIFGSTDENAFESSMSLQTEKQSSCSDSITNFQEISQNNLSSNQESLKSFSKDLSELTEQTN